MGFVFCKNEKYIYVCAKHYAVLEMAIKRLFSNDVTMCNNTKNGLSGIVIVCNARRWETKTFHLRQALEIGKATIQNNRKHNAKRMKIVRWFSQRNNMCVFGKTFFLLHWMNFALLFSCHRQFCHFAIYICVCPEQKKHVHCKYQHHHYHQQQHSV